MFSLRPLFVASALTSLALLTACTSGTVKETLGLSRNSPDEFRVLPRPALSVPPQFGLRPPAMPGEVIANGEMPANKQAEALVMGGSATTTQGETFKLNDGGTSTAQPAASAPAIQGKTSAETQFLQNAGATQADPSVRTTLMQEAIATQPQAEEEESSWWSIMPSSQPKEPIVQPGKEAERIEQNKAENKPITEGETPVAKPKDRGVLGKILGD
jgi:hypothetical protein